VVEMAAIQVVEMAVIQAVDVKVIAEPLKRTLVRKDD